MAALTGLLITCSLTSSCVTYLWETKKKCLYIKCHKIEEQKISEEKFSQLLKKNLSVNVNFLQSYHECMQNKGEHF
jgi:hypothetical protein